MQIIILKDSETMVIDLGDTRRSIHLYLEKGQGNHAYWECHEYESLKFL